VPIAAVVLILLGRTQMFGAFNRHGTMGNGVDHGSTTVNWLLYVLSIGAGRAIERALAINQSAVFDFWCIALQESLDGRQNGNLGWQGAWHCCLGIGVWPWFRRAGDTGVLAFQNLAG